MTKTVPKEADLLEQVRKFALTHIAPRRHELITAKEFPCDLWQAFGESGLAGLSIPIEFGGLGASYQTLSTAGQILNQLGGVPGATMVFMSHWQFAKLHFTENASVEIQQKIFPLLRDGKATLSVAISEPGAGAHPKHLKTTAIRDGENFILNGEKAFLTNGPLATFFIVLAITGEANGRKAFSALLVPADAEGFSCTDGVKIDFLHPCPHGGIKLENVRIPAGNLIGAEGDAFERTSLQMRAVEDAVGAAGHIGSLQCLLNDICPHTPPEHAPLIGGISTQIQALQVVATELAKKAEETNVNLNPLLELQLGFRQLIKPCIQMLIELTESNSETLSEEISLLARDISKFQSIAGNAHKARLNKIGAQLVRA